VPENLVLDLTMPDTGRVVDHWLGGNHNFAVDRLAAAQVEALTPVAQLWVRAQRRFLRASIDYLARGEQLDRFIALGAGLPTCGNVHEIASSARVLYSDVSPVTVAYGQHLLIGSPQTKYVQADARTIRASHATQVDWFLGRDRPWGIALVGLSYFFPDETLYGLFRDLYDWCPAGSRMAISFIGREAEAHAAPSLEAYARMGNPIYCRTTEEAAALMGAWQPTAEGICSAASWGTSDRADDELVIVYGAVCAK
jgi:hypothetical protein